MGTTGRGDATTPALSRSGILNSSGPGVESTDLADLLTGCGAQQDYRARPPTVIAMISLGGRAGEIVISPDNSHVYVARSNSIAVVSRVHHIVGIIGTGGHPESLTISADGSRLYASNYEGFVSVIDTADHRLGVIPRASCAQTVDTADGASIYAAHNATYGGGCRSRVSMIDADGNTVAGVNGVDGYAITGLAANPEGTRVYAGFSRRSSYYQGDVGFVGVIDATTYAPIGPIDTGASPDTITVSPDGSTMYATHHDSGFVSAVDLATHRVTPIALGDAPLGVTVTPDGSQAYVASCCSLSVIDAVTNEAARITVGDLPRCVLVSPDGKQAYVSNFGDHTVSVIDTIDRCVIDTIDVRGDPEALAVSPDGERLYVCGYWSGTLTVVSV